MKTLHLLVLAVFASGCATDPKEEAARSREKASVEIRQLVQDVIDAMKQNRPEVYHERLCKSQRDAYPIEDVRKDWEEAKGLIQERAASMEVKRVAVDESNPNVATVTVSAPLHPLKELPFQALRENGEWKIWEPRK